jgi:hypothetical protein
MLVVLLLVSAVACSDSQESALKGAEIMTAAKTATGGGAWDAIHVWHETGHALLPAGEATRYEHWADLPSLKTRNASVQGTEWHYSIFDGEAAYESTSRDFEPRSALDVKSMRAGAYVACFGFFFPNRFPASFRFDGTRIERGVPYDVVAVSPTGLDSIDVWVDQNSHYIYKVVYAGGQYETDFSDYRTVGAVTVPFLSLDNGSRIQTDSIAFEPAGSTSFALPAEH